MTVIEDPPARSSLKRSTLHLYFCGHETSELAHRLAVENSSVAIAQSHSVLIVNTDTQASTSASLPPLSR